MHYACLELDGAGVARFGDVPLAFSPLAYAPLPASPVDVSVPLPAASVFFVSAPPAWDGALRAGAHRQLFLCLSGEVEVRADDEARCFQPGSALIVAAGVGRAYPCRVVGPDAALVAVVQLDD